MSSWGLDFQSEVLLWMPLTSQCPDLHCFCPSLLFPMGSHSLSNGNIAGAKKNSRAHIYWSAWLSSDVKSPLCPWISHLNWCFGHLYPNAKPVPFVAFGQFKAGNFELLEAAFWSLILLTFKSKGVALLYMVSSCFWGPQQRLLCLYCTWAGT